MAADDTQTLQEACLEPALMFETAWACLKPPRFKHDFMFDRWGGTFQTSPQRPPRDRLQTSPGGSPKQSQERIPKMRIVVLFERGFKHLRGDS